MTVISSPTLEPKICTPPSLQWVLTGTPSINLVSGFCLLSVFTQFITEHCYLSHVTLIWVSTLYRLLWWAHVLFLPGQRVGSSFGSTSYWTSAWRAVTQSCHGLQFMAAPCWMPTPELFVAGFLALMLGNSDALRYLCFCVTQGILRPQCPR